MSPSWSPRFEGRPARSLPRRPWSPGSRPGGLRDPDRRRRGRARRPGGRSRTLASRASPPVRYLPVHGAHGPAAARNVGWRVRPRVDHRLHRRRLHPRPRLAAGGSARLHGRSGGRHRPGRRPAAGSADRLRARRRRARRGPSSSRRTASSAARSSSKSAVSTSDSRRPGARTATCTSRCCARAGGSSGPLRARRAPRAAGALGRQPQAAAEEPLQRSALQEAPAAVPAADPALAAVGLLRHPDRAGRCFGDEGCGPAALAHACPGRVGPAHGPVLPAPARADLACSLARHRNGRDLRTDPAAVGLLAALRRAQVPRALF